MYLWFLRAHKSPQRYKTLHSHQKEKKNNDNLVPCDEALVGAEILSCAFIRCRIVSFCDLRGTKIQQKQQAKNKTFFATEITLFLWR